MKTLNRMLAVSLFLATSLVAGRASAGGFGPGGGPFGSGWSGAYDYAELQSWDWNAQSTHYDPYAYDPYAYDPYAYDPYAYGGYGYDAWGADLADMGAAGLAIATVLGAQFGCGGTTLAGVYAVDPFCGY